MRSTFTTVLGVLAAWAVLSAPARAGLEDAPPSIPSAPPAAVPAGPATMVVVGDSISASYAGSGTPDQRGWWSLLAERVDADPVVLAEGGSGYLRRGTRCTGMNFLQRVEAHADTIREADIIIIEGGVNDRFYCLDVRRNGRGDAPSSRRQVVDAVRPTLARVAELARPDATVIVTAPWGGAPDLEATRDSITAVIEAAATDHGFEYVDTASEAIRAPHRTLDGVHPNWRGSSEIAKRLFFRSSLLHR